MLYSMNIETIIKEISADLKPGAGLWLAYSGGLDSSVLLHLLSQSSLPFKAIHVNHQLSPDAMRWQQHCELSAQELGVPLVCESVRVANRGRGVEDEARERRYEVFAKHLKQNDVIVFAHHQDDFAETFLFRLARGAGVNGLIGIKRRRSIADARLLRPLMQFSKQQLQEYAEQNKIKWVEDESNNNNAFDRNFLRSQVIPIFKERWPNFSAQVAKAAVWLTESQTLLDEYADEDLINVDVRAERLGESLCLDDFSRLSFVRQKLMVRRWCVRNAYQPPEARLLDRLIDLVSAREDAKPVLSWGRCELRRFRGRMFLLPQLPPTESFDIPWMSSSPLTLPDGSVLMGIEGSEEAPCRVRSRHPGDRCKPVGRHLSQTLKRLMQEYALEPWLRDRAPVLCVEDRIIAVADLFSCDIGGLPQISPNGLKWEYLREP